MISLFPAYKTATSEEFLHTVDYWENEWNSGVLQNTEQLMDKTDKRYVKICSLESWGKQSDKDDQMIALTRQVEALKKGGSAHYRPSTNSTNFNNDQDHNRKGPK